MPTFEDLTGKKIGYLTVLHRAPDWIQPSGQHKRMWHCLCICGKECDVRASDIKSGNTTSCGCQSSRKKSVGLADLTGQQFGDYIVVNRASNKTTPSGQQIRVWHCKCIKCGIEKDIQASQLKNFSGACECSRLQKKSEKELAKKKIEFEKRLESEKKLEIQRLKKEKKLEIQLRKIENKQKSKRINTEILNGEILKNWEKEYPDIMREWDTSNNLDILNKHLSKNTIAWWICPIGHSYDMRIRSRMEQKCGCPYCSVPAKRILKGFNDLATTHPHVLKEWDYDKNVISPEEITSGSAKKVWWKCKKGHSFEQSIVYKAKSKLESTCPYCSHQKLLTGFNDLATTHAYILEEWDYEKNTVLPTQIGVGTHKKIWWKCPFGHSYQTHPSNRCGKQRTGCPICDKENHTSFPEQAVLYYLKKIFADTINSDKETIGMELDIFIPQLNVAVEYDGKTWHQNNEYERKKNTACKEKGIKLIRIREEGLPLYEECICLVRKNIRSNNGLTKVINELLKMLTDIDIDVDVDRDSSLIYSAYIEIRKSKSLASIYPEIAKEWHPTKNGQLTPWMVAPIANKKVWWLGKCGHEYQMDLGDRTNQNCSCPFCSGKRILKGYNDFETWCKETDNMYLLEEWDYTKNNILPTEVTKSSDKMIFWRCKKCKNVWRTKVDSRTRMKSGCPRCASYYRNARPVINLDTNIVYESMDEASKILNINSHCIGNVCRGKQKTAGGYRWAYYNN